MARILLVEDDDELVNRGTHWLERAGYTVEHAADGAAALEMLDRAPLPALVLIDAMLPKMDGLELLRRLRAQSRTRLLPAILVTTRSREDDAARGRALGANDTIVKPLVELDLVKRVQHIIEDQ